MFVYTLMAVYSDVIELTAIPPPYLDKTLPNLIVSPYDVISPSTVIPY